MKHLPYYQTCDGNYWYHIFFEIFLKDILMSQRIFVVQLSQKTLKELPNRSSRENALNKRLQNPRQSGFGSLISLHDLRSGSFLCQELMDTNAEGSWSFASEPNHGLCLGYGFEFAWRSWVAYFITLCWPPVSWIDPTYWTRKVVFILRLWRNFAWKKLQCLKVLP